MRKLILLITILLLQSAMAAGQDRNLECRTNRTAPPTGFPAWPSDAQIKVYFVRGMFTADQKQALLRAMDLWSEAAKRKGAGVTFTYAGESDRIDSCKSCLTVTRREVRKSDRKHYSFFNGWRLESDNLIQWAWIDFDIATTEPKALQGFMAHELGHGMGLEDCISCKKKQTIMSAFPGINRDNGLIEPSACDLEVVRQVYELQRRVASNTASNTGRETKHD